MIAGRILNHICGLTCIETLLGWTILGKSPSSSDSNSTLIVIVLLVNECTISDLWKLEAIKIFYPAESKLKTKIHQDTMEYFRSILTINEEGRYKVALPLILESSRLPDNQQMAEKCLHSVYKKTDGI